MRQEPGFSLAEMLVVMAILSLCLGLALPFLHNSLRAGSVAGAAKEVAGLFRSGRAEAIYSGVETTVTFDLERGEAKASWSGKAVAMPAEAEVTLLTALQEVVDAESASYRFFPDGSASGGSVRLRSRNATQVVTIDWLTGRIDRAADGQ